MKSWRRQRLARERYIQARCEQLRAHEKFTRELAAAWSEVVTTVLLPPGVKLEFVTIGFDSPGGDIVQATARAQNPTAPARTSSEGGNRSE